MKHTHLSIYLLQDGLEHIHDITIALDMNGRAQLLDLRLNRSVHVIAFSVRSTFAGCWFKPRLCLSNLFWAKTLLDQCIGYLALFLRNIFVLKTVQYKQSYIYQIHKTLIKLTLEFIFTLTSYCLKQALRLLFKLCTSMEINSRTPQQHC